MAQYQTATNNLYRNQPVTAPASGTTYAALQTDRFIDITASGAYALSLPAPATSGATANVGKEYTITDVAGNASTNNITVTPASGLINGSATFVISNNYESVTFQSDGTNYWVTTIANAASSGMMGWTNVSGTSATLAGGNGYYTTNAAATTVTLPASPTAGQIIDIVQVNTGLVTVAQNATQQIRFGTATTTVGIGGSITFSAQGDSMKILCTTAGTAAFWQVIRADGNLLVT